LLTLINSEFDVLELTKNNPKIEMLYFSLIRKGLITEFNKLTTEGKNIIEFLNEQEPQKLVKKRAVVSDFENWWKSFPGTDTFVHKGVKFVGSRAIRVDKTNCKIKFNSIVAEGEYTASQLIEALEYDILQKKEMSIEQKSNKITYLQNSLTYLRQRSFEPYLELIAEGINIKEAHVFSGGTDI
jgi:hypothetical protein